MSADDFLSQENNYYFTFKKKNNVITSIYNEYFENKHCNFFW